MPNTTPFTVGDRDFTPLFVDSFSGEVAQVNLDAHTPDTGTGWTVLVGGSGSQQVNPDGSVYDFSLAPIQYASDNMGSTDMYVMYRVNLLVNGSANPGCTVHTVDTNNYLAVRYFGTGSLGLRMTQVIGGVVTELIQGQAGGPGEWVLLSILSGVARLHTAGTAATPGAWVQFGTDQNYAGNLTDTKTGIIAPTSNTGLSWMTDYEAGTVALSGGGGFNPVWANRSNNLIGGL